MELKIRYNSKIKNNDNSKSEVDSFKNGDLVENENTEVLSFKDKSKEFVENNEDIISNQSNNKSSNQNLNNVNNNIFNNIFHINITNKIQQKKQKEYSYLKNLSPNQKFIINMKRRNSEKDNKEITNQSMKNGEINQISEKKILDLDMFNKLKNINLSLNTEKNYTCFFKKLNKDISSNNPYKEINNSIVGNNKLNSRSKKSTVYSQEMTSGSTNSNIENFYYPNVYYINGENHLHTKTHISMLFTKLKNKNNN